MEIKEEDIKEVKSTKYSIKCPFCEQDITGTKRSQVIFNLKVHISAKHEVKE